MKRLAWMFLVLLGCSDPLSDQPPGQVEVANVREVCGNWCDGCVIPPDPDPPLPPDPNEPTRDEEVRLCTDDCVALQDAEPPACLAARRDFLGCLAVDCIRPEILIDCGTDLANNPFVEECQIQITESCNFYCENQVAVDACMLTGFCSPDDALTACAPCPTMSDYIACLTDGVQCVEPTTTP